MTLYYIHNHFLLLNLHDYQIFDSKNWKETAEEIVPIVVSEQEKKDYEKGDINRFHNKKNIVETTKNTYLVHRLCTVSLDSDNIEELEKEVRKILKIKESITLEKITVE